MPEGHTIHRLAAGPPGPLRGRAGPGEQPAGQVRRRRRAARRPGHGRPPRRTASTSSSGSGRPAGSTSTSACSASSASATAPAPPPTDTVRLRLATVRHYADLRGPTTCALITDAEKHAIHDRLGPDPLRPGDDGGRAPGSGSPAAAPPIAALLMDQKVIAGVGNVYRAEVLFRHGIDPYRPGRDLTRAEWDALWADLVLLMREGVRHNRIDTVRPEHLPEAMGRPPRVDDHGGEVYVYRRADLPLPHLRRRDPHRRSRRPQPLLVPGLPAGDRRPPALSGRGRPARQAAPRRTPQNPCGSHGATSDPNATDAAASAPGRSSRTRPAAASVVQREARPGTPSPTPVPTGPDPAGSAVRAQEAPAGVTGQPPTPLVPGAEGVRHLQHHVHRRPVRPRRQRRAHLHRPHEQRLVAASMPQRRMSADQMQQRIVHRPAARRHRRRQVDPEQVAPQRRVRHRVQRLEIAARAPRPHGPAWSRLRRHRVARVPRTSPSTSASTHCSSPAPVPLALGVVQHAHPLPARLPREHPGPGRAPAARTPARSRPAPPPGPPAAAVRRRCPAGPGARSRSGVDAQPQLLRRRAVAEPAVDRRLRGGQHRERLTARPDVVQLVPHHRAQHARAGGASAAH